MCAVEDMSGYMSEDPVEEGERPSPLVRYGTDTTSGPALQSQSGLQGRPGLQHLGTTQVRPRTGDHLTETISDYLGFFQELQIDPMYHATFWTSIIYRYRQTTRHLPLLKRGTEASIKNMTDDVLRAYGERVWGHKSEWRSELAEGEEMLVYDKDGANTRLHEIFAKMWWTMRELVFEEKPQPKRRRKSQPTTKASGTSAGGPLSETDETYQADIDDDNTPFVTDSEAGTAMAPPKSARAKTTEKLNKLQSKLPASAPGTLLTAEQTEDAILDIIERLENLRIASHPDVFERVWLAHIGRTEEIEAPVVVPEVAAIRRHAAEEGSPLSTVETETGDQQHDFDTYMQDETASVSTAVAAVPLPTNLLSDEEIRKRVYPNYSAEPFNTSGNPIPPSLTEQYRLPPTLPKVMSVYIMASPPHVAYLNRAYHHPAAPVLETDQVAFFKLVTERAEHIAEKDVMGYVLSYGWCDIARWIEKTVGRGSGGVGNGEEAGESEGERVGWGLFQKDLIDAAMAGVMVWRMKVLVVKN